MTGLVLLLAATGWWAVRRVPSQDKTQARPLPVMGLAPDYALMNQWAEPVNAHEFAGRVQIVSFLFPYCTNYCPLIAAKLTKIAGRIQDAHLQNSVRIVSFNVDPEHTGPVQMRAFMRQYGWNPRDLMWQFLTGKPDAMRRVIAEGFHVYYRTISLATEAANRSRALRASDYVPEPTMHNALAKQAKPDYDVVHNDVIVIVGQHGHLRRYFMNGSQVSTREIMVTLRQLLRASRSL